MSTNRKAAYAVEVIGFNQTERIVLSSIFGLSARREPKFLQHSSVAYAPDIYLVDAADPQAVALFKARNAHMVIPAIFIGDSSHGTANPVLARPLQWTKLFRAFDLAIAGTMQKSVSAEPAASAPAAPLPATSPYSVPSAPLPPTILAKGAPTAPPLPIQPAPAPIHAPAPAPSTVPLPVTEVAQMPAPGSSAHLYPPSANSANSHAQQAARVGTGAIVPSPISLRNDADWVLIVDDNMTVREFMKNKLAPFNFNVDYASSGEQAVGFTGGKRYTCVFLDVIMPGIDGYQVCKLIKSKKAANKTAVVMLTSKGSPFDKIRGAMAGCDAYLTKPVDEDKLLETIVRFLPVRK